MTRFRTRRARGHTLLELTISMALGLLITVAAISLYRTQRVAFENANDTQRMRDAASIALWMIGQHIQMAGFVPADAPASARTAPLFGCAGARVAGSDGAPSCETLASRSDGILVRYVGDAISTWPTSTGQPSDCLGQAVTVTLATDTPGAPIVNRFYAKTSASTGEPELYCEGSGKTGTAQPLVEGVERVRLRYWLASAADARDASAMRADDWTGVVAVDVCVLVRGAPRDRRMRYVDCDGVSQTAGDTRARVAYMRRVALRNVAERA